MKAAVINSFGETPRYLDFPNPVAGENETIINVKAAVLENLDKATASGKHYSSNKLFPDFPAVIGMGGAGLTPDGQLVVFRDMQPPYGSYAEMAAAEQLFPVPAGISAAKATAIPPSALTCLLPLKYAAKLQPGETVLINGITGVSGRIALQIAKMLGAGKVIGTGRNKTSLQEVLDLGADQVIDLNQTEEALTTAFNAINGIDVVLDFIWGQPAQVLINSFIPKEGGFAKRTIRYVQIGAKAGMDITLSGPALRTSGLQLMGIGKVTTQQVMEEIAQIWKWIGEDKLYMNIEEVPLSKIDEAWQRDDLSGKRIVLIP